ncbi:MAG: hypothetical protein IT230_07110 [Flavobacteriales bacterium]|nr:hypothetical protein [Flavobacteriales bacterium]
MPNSNRGDQPQDGPPQQQITAKDGSPFEVTKEGSLSLLALGYRGLMAWRAKRASAMEEQEAPKHGTHGQA